MRFGVIFSIVSFTSLICGISMFIPAALDFYIGNKQSAYRFCLSGGITVLISVLGLLVTDMRQASLKTKEMFLTTSLIWIFFGLFSALPFYLSPYQIPLTDALFESVSGLTTTGSSVLSGLDYFPRGLLLWRSMIQCLGGIGIVILAITVLPVLHIGGMQFFNTESSAQSERDLPTVAQSLRAILYYFLFLSAVCAVCLWLAGMNAFDALNHAMTTISTGGFSTHDASIAYFNSPTIEWIITFFMTIAGLPLLLGPIVIMRQWSQITQNIQIKTFFVFLFWTIFLLSFIRWHQTEFAPETLSHIIRSSAFAVVSVVTTTGFVSDNYQLWGSFAVSFFLFLLATGSCTGSTSGGIKMFRLSVIFKTVGIRLRTLIQPYGVFIPRYGARAISDDVLISVLVFIGLFLFTATVCTLILSAAGLDLITSLSAALSSIANVGPGLGDVIGPDKTFAMLPDSAKWTLIIAMMMGRLEFISIIVLFFPFLWKKNA